MNSILLVFLGGGVGLVARYLVGVNAPRLLGARFPHGAFTPYVAASVFLAIDAVFMGQLVAHRLWA